MMLTSSLDASRRESRWRFHAVDYNKTPAELGDGLVLLPLSTCRGRDDVAELDHFTLSFHLIGVQSGIVLLFKHVYICWRLALLCRFKYFEENMKVAVRINLTRHAC